MISKRLLNYLFVLTIIAVAISSCDRQPYVLAQEIQIEYRDTVRLNDWISIDGVKFTHVDNYNVLKEDTLKAQYVFENNLLPTTIQGVTVPGADDHEFSGYSSNADVALALFQSLSLSEKNDLGQFYGFKGHTLELSSGKFKFYRKDGEKIKVMTSEGYGGIVRKLK